MAAQLKSIIAKPNPSDYMGIYQDHCFKDVIISSQDKNLHFKAVKLSDLTGTMSFYKGTTYAAHWNDPSLKADAFVTFSLDIEGKINGFTMSPIPSLTDFSYDFQDLDFNRVE